MTPIHFTKYLLKMMKPSPADPMIIHANCVEVHGVGILLLGPAGSGKSETTLALLDRGHCFIADDSVKIIAKNKAVYAHAYVINQAIHISGIGLINLNNLLLNKNFKDSTRIDLCINLHPEANHESKLDETSQTILLDHTLIKIDFYHCQQRNLALLIETAAKCFISEKKEYNPAVL